jgi:hypothetical protein
VIGKRPEADRLLIAELFGEARHRAKWRPLTADEEDAAVAELRTLTGGRADLLAEVCGVLLDAREGALDEPLTRQAAAPCRKAGTDQEAIPTWIEEGRRRRAATRQPPFGGVLLPAVLPAFEPGLPGHLILLTDLLTADLENPGCNWTRHPSTASASRPVRQLRTDLDGWNLATDLMFTTDLPPVGVFV